MREHGQKGHGAFQAELAAHGGFSDESHLLREFRALAGATPRELRTRDVGFIQAARPAPP